MSTTETKEDLVMDGLTKKLSVALGISSLARRLGTIVSLDKK